MKSIYQKILRRGIFAAAMLTVCAVGIKTALTRSEENAPVSMTAANQTAPVIVLDAGHGEST